MDLVSGVCELKEVQTGLEWVNVSENMGKYSKAVITLGRECRGMGLSVVNAEIKALIYEHSRLGDLTIYTDGSVQQGNLSGWGYSARCNGKIVHEDRQFYTATTYSMRMEIDAATAARG